MKIIIKKPLPKHLTPVTGVSQLVAWHTKLDIAAYRMLNGQSHLYIQGIRIDSMNPVQDVQNYMNVPPRQAADCIRVFYKIHLL